MPIHESPIYKPPFWAKNPVAQTSLNRMAIRRWGANAMIDNTKETIITAADRGHVGFVGPILRKSWYEKVVLQLIKN